MAKAPKIDTDLLSKIVAGTVSYVSQAEATPLLAHNPPLIEVNTGIQDPNDATKVACRATDAGKAYETKHEAAVAAHAHEPSKYTLITNAALPEAKKRGNSAGAGAPTKYPFAEMQVGQSFFSANSEHKNKDAVKALGSTVSSQNRKYAEETGEHKTVTRAVRDKHTHKAQVGPDGKKVTETVQLPVLKYNRKFTIRPVEAGKTYGQWVAPENGALIARTV